MVEDEESSDEGSCKEAKFDFFFDDFSTIRKLIPFGKKGSILVVLPDILDGGEDLTPTVEVFLEHVVLRLFFLILG